MYLHRVVAKTPPFHAKTLPFSPGKKAQARLGPGLVFPTSEWGCDISDLSIFNNFLLNLWLDTMSIIKALILY